MSTWFVLIVQPGLVYPEDPGPVRYKAPDKMTWAIVDADTHERAEELAVGPEEELYGSALLSEYKLAGR